MILLRERTLSGQFDVMRQVGNTSIAEDDMEDDISIEIDVDQISIQSSTRSALDRVDEEDPEMDPDYLNVEESDREQDHSLDPTHDQEMPIADRQKRRPGPGHRRRTSSTHSSSGGASRGESLAGLPITGPGLDLAAELGRAASKDGLPDFDERDRSAHRGKRSKKGSTEPRKTDGGDGDYDQLRNEVKNLKDANKALSLYASKIIDRIISQEGFEHVLAVDFDKQPTPTPNQVTFPVPAPPTNTPVIPPKSKARPQSVMLPRTTASPGRPERLTTFASPPTPTTPKTDAAKKSNRRSFSLDWSSFSIFSGEPKKVESPRLRPLTLKPGAIPVTGPSSAAAVTARKLDTQEDEDDRRERERLHATMKLMGIEPPVSPSPRPPSPIPDFGLPTSPIAATPTAAPSRFSFFRAKTTTPASEGSPSIHTSSPAPSLKGGDDGGNADVQGGLTTEAVAQATAENSLAALDAHEAVLSADIARGSGGGFTEIPRRSATDRKSRRSSRMSGRGSSGSTVFSAGIDEDE